MPRLRRIVFGEPQPGFARFAAILQKLDESVSYCNHPGVLQHDRVTDVPFTLPEVGFDFVHPTPVVTDKIQQPGTGIGFFTNHHIALYQTGALKANLDPVHLKCVQLCAAIYASKAGWDAFSANDLVWGIHKDGTRIYVVFRGSDSLIDWLRDITAIDPSSILQHDTFGPMWGGFLLGMEAAWQVIRSQLNDAEEIVMTGHSLGAARATIGCGYYLTEQNNKQT
jgi:hypothetical protein